MLSPMYEKQTLTYRVGETDWPLTRSRNGYESASLVSKVFFWYLNRLILFGHRTEILSEDLWIPLKNDDPEAVNRLIEKEWQMEKKQDSRKPNLWYAFMRLDRGDVALSILLSLCGSAASFGYPVLIDLFIQWMASSRDNRDGWILVACFFILPVLINMFQSHSFLLVSRAGLRCRTAAQGLVFRKTLSISQWSRADSSTGEITNLMSSDAQKVMDALLNLPGMYGGIAQIIAALVLLYLYLGPAMFIGLLAILLIIPLSAVLAVRMTAHYTARLKISDLRAKLMSEIIFAIRILKYYAWEEKFADSVSSVRAEELRKLRQVFTQRVLMKALIFVSPVVVSLATFLAYSGFGNAMDANTVFTALSLLNLLRWPLVFLPANVVALIQGRTSTGRIQAFLSRDDVQNCALDVQDPCNQVEFHDASFSWRPHIASSVGRRIVSDNGGSSGPLSPTANMQIRRISLTIPAGQHVALVGKVGSGKSSLLQAILGELKLGGGDCRIRKGSKIAYVSQESWIRNQTLKENILFGAELDCEFYQKVLDACALSEDLLSLPAGDDTEIGEKGINLSGGQKARVSLARACYASRSADLFLLDDPLAAVDAHVGRHIFEEVICGLLRSKTVILVTQHVYPLRAMDRIVVLENGGVSFDGSLQSIAAQGFSMIGLTVESNVVSEKDVEVSAQQTLLANSYRSPVPSFVDDKSDVDAADMQLRGKRISRGNATAEEKARSTLVLEESRASGMSGRVVLWRYVQAAGGVLALCVFVPLAILAQAAFNMTDVWLSFWTNNQFGEQSFAFYAGIYAGISVGATILIWIRGQVYCLYVIVACKKLHNLCLRRVIRFPVVFFDTTPTGRIMNRFSKDMSDVDDTFPDLVENLAVIFLWQLGSLAVVAAIIPLFVVAIPPMVLLYYGIQRFYISTCRQLRRWDAVLRSPIISHFAETLQGVDVIRAFGKADSVVLQEHWLLSRKHLPASSMEFLSTRWLDFWLGFLNAFLMGFSAMFLVLARNGDGETSSIDPSDAGLVLTSAASVLGLLNFAVFLAAMVESGLNSVDRILHYDSLPVEPPARLPFPVEPGTAAAAPTTTRTTTAMALEKTVLTWPNTGHLEFRNVVMRYRPQLEPVLRGINLDVRAGNSVGIVGRTGAGKSSLLTALFRMTELDSGSILIDGVDISKLGLHTLREAITIIPQHPVLFSGTLRSNIDPCNSVSDDKIWDALALAGLDSIIVERFNGLQEQKSEASERVTVDDKKFRKEVLQLEVAESGSNFSVGERQLLCLVRALLRPAKIIVLDEATADVDTASDLRIQHVVREHLKGSTILTIAHRINTIMDADQIVVLQDGLVAECDSPAALLDNPNSRFRSFVDEYGPQQVHFLYRVAHKQASIFDAQ
eukprot:ANDGO_03846.mRNA.1 ABC transporter C family member 10